MITSFCAHILYPFQRMEKHLAGYCPFILTSITSKKESPLCEFMLETWQVPLSNNYDENAGNPKNKGDFSPLFEYLFDDSAFHFADVINVIHHIKSLFKVVSGIVPADSICEPDELKAIHLLAFFGQHLIRASCLV